MEGLIHPPTHPHPSIICPSSIHPSTRRPSLHHDLRKITREHEKGGWREAGETERGNYVRMRAGDRDREGEMETERWEDKMNI